MKHEHVWGTWVRRGAYHYRLCTNGWCPMGQYRSGRVFVARPERSSIGIELNPAYAARAMKRLRQQRLKVPD